MKKLRAKAYKIVLAGAVAAALLAAVLGLAAAVQGAGLLGWAVALGAGALAGVAVAVHFRTGHILRAVRRSQPVAVAQQLADPSGLVAVDNALLNEIQELRRSVKLSLNNELFLLDELQRLRHERDHER